MKDYTITDESLIEKFKDTLDSPPPKGRQKEQIVQDFMENNSVLIPTIELLNHQLHYNLIISKFKLNTNLISDYVYITKSSDSWRIFFVELEQPDKRIFLDDLKTPHFSSEFNAAITQVNTWQNYIKYNRADIINRLNTILVPLSMQRNPIEFRYQLILGRSQNKNLSQDRKIALAEKKRKEEINVMTYDQVISWYENFSWKQPRNIISFNGERMNFKYMPEEAGNILSYLGPDIISFSQEQEQKLKNLNYEIDRWKKGKLLSVNGKYVDLSSLKKT